MDAKKKRLMTVLLVVGFVFVGLVMLNGCKKEEPAAAPNDTSSAHDHEHGEEGHTHEHSEMAMTTETKEVASTGEQTTCPIMEGKPINKAVFTEYKGKKVYFCCPGCDGKFKEDPEKYIAKLPQFNQ
jgi:YHS domain-containing protein